MLRPLVIGLALSGCSLTLELDAPGPTIVSDLGAAADLDAAPDAARDAAAPPPKPRVDASPPPVADAALPDAEPFDAAPPPDAALAPVTERDLVGAGGRGDGARWDEAGLRLAADADVGVFVSRPFVARPGLRWRTLRWRPHLPYGRPLPDGGAVEAAFTGGAADMRDNVLLLHLDDGLRGGEALVDASPRGTTGVVEGAPGAAPGLFGGGGRLGRTDRLALPSEQPAFDPGEGDFTWALFVRSEPCVGRNNVWMGGEDADAGRRHLWLGCQIGAPCADDGTGLGGAVRDVAGTVIDICGEAAVGDGGWHHLALVKRGHRPGRVVYLFDGEPVVQSEEVAWAGGFGLDGGRPFTIGGFPVGEYWAAGDIDEVAIWHRALSDDEVRGIAARGLASAQVEVRVCADAGCGEVGPFVTLEGADDGPGWLGAALPEPAAYVQYRVVLGRHAGPSPVVWGVELTAAP
ncbi:MAG: LamG domain-containing protein [Myxococcales bacterium]|nr:LamG domain-containing protein [Myxococcales bacterium]